MTTVARHLATSPRSLQRQLQAEGTTFQAVLTGTREHLARHYLAHSTMITAEIAYLLAYDDTNSFYRAFRTWTGSTPDTVRTATTSTTAPRPETGRSACTESEGSARVVFPPSRQQPDSIAAVDAFLRTS